MSAEGRLIIVSSPVCTELNLARIHPSNGAVGFLSSCKRIASCREKAGGGKELGHGIFCRCSTPARVRTSVLSAFDHSAVPSTQLCGDLFEGINSSSHLANDR